MKLLTTVLLIIFFLSSSNAAVMQNQDYTNNVKAAFIYNFTKYLSWAEQERPIFTIAVFGKSALVPLLQEIAQKRRFEQREIEIKQYYDAAQIEQCDILFISETGKNHLAEITARLHGKNTLLISEINGALVDGVMINFLNIEETIKFEINLKAMNEAHFHPSSQLLKVAVRVIE